jgi:hypothetical protein
MPDSNRITYGGQGTSAGTLSNDLPGLNHSSLEAQQPKTAIHALASLELLSTLDDRTPEELAEARTEHFLGNIDDAPWRHFTSEPSMTSDATEMSSLFFGPIDIEGSMENNPVGVGSRSMLSSYMSGMTLQSEAASVAVQHAGAAPTVARLTPVNQRHQYLELL